MPFLKSLAEDAGPRDIFDTVPDLFVGWAETGERLYRGPSELSPGERELIVSFVAALNACDYCYGSHAPIAEAWGIDPDVLGVLVEDVDRADIDARLKPIFRYVRKLTLAPARVRRDDVTAILDAGWTERTFYEVVMLCARMNFMNRVTSGFGLTPPAPADVKQRAAALVARARDSAAAPRAAK